MFSVVVVLTASSSVGVGVGAAADPSSWFGALSSFFFLRRCFAVVLVSRDFFFLDILPSIERKKENEEPVESTERLTPSLSHVEFLPASYEVDFLAERA